MQAVFGIKREKNNQLYYSEYQNDKGPFHFHSSIELYFIDEGEMEVFVNDKKTVLEAGQMSVSLSFCPHGYKTQNFSRSAVLIIPTYLCTEFINYIKDKKVLLPFILQKDKVAQIRSYSRKIIKNDINPIKRQGYLQLLLGTVLDCLTFESYDSCQTNDLTSNLLVYINENIKNNISLKCISTHFGYSESYISKNFKNQLGIGVNQYINLLKLKTALQLMSEEKHNITYCAFESGFSSMRTFYRVFSENFNCTPKQWINQNKQ